MFLVFAAQFILRYNTTNYTVMLHYREACLRCLPLHSNIIQSDLLRYILLHYTLFCSITLRYITRGVFAVFASPLHYSSV